MEGLTQSLEGLFGGASYAFSVVICIGLALAVIGVWGLFAPWLERKASADFQCRLGPMYAGGFHGWLQTIAVV